MDNNQNTQLPYWKIAALILIAALIWNKASKPSVAPELQTIAAALSDASKKQDKGAASMLFDKLTELKYKYADEKNTPCFKAVMALTGSADEINATGHWTGKEETINAIEQCKS